MRTFYVLPANIYADLYLEPWTEKTSHTYIIELKYCTANDSDAEVEAKRTAAIDLANKYTADKHLQQRADTRGWTLHKFTIVFRGWKLALCEEIA